MQQTNTPGKLTLPFANAGAKNTIPAASQIGIVAGAASLVDGFPPLTRTPIAAGGVPPSGADMNGILFELSAIARWAVAGGGYAYDGTFAADSNVNGYPKGARVLRSDAKGYWLNTAENNTTDPEAAGAAAAGWVPDFTTGVTAVTMTNANVTLDRLQYGKPIIVITGTLTANLNLIFPDLAGEWAIINNTTGAFAITAKTAAGTGVALSATGLIVGDGTNIYSATASAAQSQTQIQSVSASVAANALTLGYAGGSLQFRSATLTNGVPNSRTASSISLVVPSGATLGTVSGQSARLVMIAIDNAGTVELAVANLAGGVNLDETVLISTTAISGASNSAGVIYSTTARSNAPFRVVGFIDISEATAGTWATAPTLVQGSGGEALAALSAIGYGQTVTNFTVGTQRINNTTYYNTTGKPILVSLWGSSTTSASTASVNGIQVWLLTSPTGNMSCGTSFIVPPGGSYSTNFTNTLSGWVELR